MVDDPRVEGGDGLGPVSNARSCAACHNQGGAGGAGPPSRNAPVLGVNGTHRAPPPLFGLGLLVKLPREQQEQVLTFLDTLVAP